MNKKIMKLLYLLDKDSRFTTKQLAKGINTSQQSASYLRGQLEKRKEILGYVTVVDPVKLGLVNVLVGYNYQKFDAASKKKVLDYLRKEPSVVSIVQGEEGMDLLVEFSEHNMSAFNKTNLDILQKFSESLEGVFIFPVVVKHQFLKKYLVRQMDDSFRILSGDRELAQLNERETSVLRALVEFPGETLSKLSRKVDVSVKTFITIKKKLEAKQVIRGYSYLPNIEALGVRRSLLFLRLSGVGLGEMDTIVEFARSHRNCIELVKIIGEYNVMLVVEGLERIKILDELRSAFSIAKYARVPVSGIVYEGYGSVLGV